MQNTINFLRKKQGYVSIEMVVIGGLVVGLGAGLIGQFSQSGSTQVQNSVNVIESSFNQDNFPGIFK